jgi:hypothetical protein
VWKRIKKRFHRAINPLASDFHNIARFGTLGPVAYERIWVNPQEVTVTIPDPAEIGVPRDGKDFTRLLELRTYSTRLAGKVIDTEFDKFTLVPLNRIKKIEACRKRWEHGLGWEDAGAIDALMFKIKALRHHMSGCRTREDVLRRYRLLDRIFAEVHAAGGFSDQARREMLFRRDPDGIQIHVGPKGQLIFGAHGTHRLAMALVLGLPKIPASLGFVHRSALGHLPKLRVRPPDHLRQRGAGAVAGTGAGLRGKRELRREGTPAT